MLIRAIELEKLKRAEFADRVREAQEKDYSFAQHEAFMHTIVLFFGRTKERNKYFEPSGHENLFKFAFSVRIFSELTDCFR